VRLPNPDVAYVDPKKLWGYLLSRSHPVGRFKASFFGMLGYTQENWRLLEQQLLEIARSGEAELEQETPYGTKYRIRATIKGPSGTDAELITVWIVLAHEELPRFVTAFPGGNR
jgi:hypothetical protein